MFPNNGNAMSESVKGLLQSAGKGRTLTIENIRIKREKKEWKIPSKIYFV